ncbi:hypothetical protein KK083_18705 [Fulvivirgaceae bacterium PWU4]|uniref:Nucleotidyltransferase family protein n=1 Tax=Chryseosolibacter histidini TaxID=2782349 RepID=A0AAP2GK30_9BACT|nr:hypothetical protein [Chryseosolibacter histidini]MBT1698931.1 hypothetical protein [Chryseosolibacter histidini]
MLVNETNEYYRRLTLFSKVNRVAVSFHNANPSLEAMTAIDLENDEIISFLRDLHSADVKYLLVGGFAVAFHGLVRATHDLDLWIKSEEENLRKLKEILIRHGVQGLTNARSFELIPGFTQFPLGDSGFLIDPMKSLKAFGLYDFDQCYERAAQGEYKGVSFKVISRGDLLKEKEANNRAKDQGDIEYLRSIDKK